MATERSREGDGATVACLNCERLERALQAERQKVGRALVDSENLEVELRVKRARITKLEKQLQGEADQAPRLEEAKAVFVYWRHRLAPKARSFKGKRRTAVLERLADKPRAYSVLALLDAIDGAKATAKYEAQHELEYICRDPTITDRFIAAHEARERRREAARWASLTEGERAWLAELDVLFPERSAAAAQRVAA